MSAVLSPREAADELGVSHQTVRRWIAEGACPNAFATLPGTRIGVPRWWVDQIISAPSVVVGAGSGGAAPRPAAAGSGTPTLRSVPGSHPGAA